MTGVTYRHPGLLAKTASTVDVLSGGRSILGIGAAWYEREHRLDVLRKHCADVGRDDAEIKKTAMYQGRSLNLGDVDGFIAEMADYARLGVQQVNVIPPGAHAAEWIDKVCAPAVPRLAELPG